MKHIVVCCDGTWNNRDRTKNDTSVAHIAQILESARKNGRSDIVPIYIEGVGATSGLSGLRKALDKLRGGALGRGLTRNVRRGFGHIVRNYEPGDRIYIFGFSRGAYTARSLGGLVRSSGIPKSTRLIKKALRRYRNPEPETHPKSEESLKYRLKDSPDFYTTDGERDWRAQNGHPTGDPINIAYLGIFDTVGTNGVPGVLGQLGLLPGGHGFHDHELSSMVHAGRHAIGLDERRVLYKHTPWTNLAKLNDERGTYPDGSVRFQQQWFPGVHGMIGGSGADRRLSNSVMEWILEGADDAGLKIDVPEKLQAKADDYAGGLSNDTASFDPTAWVKAPRRGPTLAEIGDLHPVALLRLRWREEYRPKSLKRMLRVGGWQRRVADALGNTRFASIKPATRRA